MMINYYFISFILWHFMVYFKNKSYFVYITSKNDLTILFFDKKKY